MQVAVLFDRWAAISEEQPSEKVHAPFVSHLQQSGFLKVNLSRNWIRPLRLHAQQAAPATRGCQGD